MQPIVCVFLPEQLINSLEEFVDYYNNNRYHESLSNVTPADVYFGNDKQILKKRNEIRQKTMRTEENYIKICNFEKLNLSTLIYSTWFEDVQLYISYFYTTK